MTPIILVDELIQFITQVVSGFLLETNVPNAPQKAPQVIGGYLDEKKPHSKQETPDFPYVIVRYLDDTDTLESNIAQVRIIAGTYSQDAQNGWRDAFNVVTRVKTELLKHPVIGGCFRVDREDQGIKRELPEEQPFPEWIAMLTVPFVMPQVHEEVGDF